MSTNKRRRQALEFIEEEEENELDEIEEYNELLLQKIDFVFVPNENGDDLEDSDVDCDEDDYTEGNYEFFYDKYDKKQTLLLENHIYKWNSGEAKYENPPNDLIFLTDRN